MCDGRISPTHDGQVNARRMNAGDIPSRSDLRGVGQIVGLTRIKSDFGTLSSDIGSYSSSGAANFRIAQIRPKPTRR